MYTYCVFCDTNRCGAIAEYLCKAYGLNCIYPKMVQRKWIHGEMTEAIHDYLPGYLFIYTEEKLLTRPYANGILRYLGDGPLSGSDESFALMLQQKEGLVDYIQVVDRDGWFYVQDPGWDGVDVRILKVDKSRKRCCIEIDFDGSAKKIWIGYNVVKEAEPEPGGNNE